MPFYIWDIKALKLPGIPGKECHKLILGSNPGIWEIPGIMKIFENRGRFTRALSEDNI